MRDKAPIPAKPIHPQQELVSRKPPREKNSPTAGIQAVSNKKNKKWPNQRRKAVHKLRDLSKLVARQPRQALFVQVSCQHEFNIKFLGTTFLVDSKYEYIKQVGHGAYGVVCSAYDHTARQKVAIKKVPKAFEDLIDAKRIVREIKLLKFFDQKNIINLIDILKPPAPTGYEDIYIVTELMETDMHRVIYSRQELTDEHLQYFMH